MKKTGRGTVFTTILLHNIKMAGERGEGRKTGNGREERQGTGEKKGGDEKGTERGEGKTAEGMEK